MPVEVVFNHLPAVIATVLLNEDNLAKGVATGMEGYAKNNVPVLFGFLKASIHTTGGGGTFEVTAQSTEGGAPRDYAGFVEFGTTKMAAQPYMLPAYVQGLTTTLPNEARQFGNRVEQSAASGAVVG